MRSIPTLLLLVPAVAGAQSLVNTAPENRTALLEDFTGIHCGYCPEGHVIAASLEAALTDRLVVVGVHAGVFAVPSTGEPDFRTPEGTDIDAHFTISGYPAGVIGRHLFGGADDLGRGAWEGAVNELLTLPSPVNVGVESSYDSGTQELTVHVHALYTSDSPSGNDYVSVLVKENHLIGWQTDYANGNHTDYDHVHVLRHYLTDTWGEDVGNPTAGSTVDRTYTYTVPATWNIANCEVVAFVSEYQSEVYQAREVAADGGTTLVIGDLVGDPLPYRGGTDATLTSFTGSFTNGLGVDDQYLVSLTVNGQPAGWTAGFKVDGVSYTSSTTVSITSGASVALEVDVTPGPDAGIGHYELSVASLSNPGAPILFKEYHVISGVHDLVVTNPQAEAYEPLYLGGLDTEPAKAATTRADYLAFAQAGALNDVNNLYLNISWTFPSYTDAVANALAAFMDAGGNLMIAGQDIGWDQSGATGSYGTPVTQAFYTDHLLADFVADGSSADSQVNFEDADAVFGPVPNSTINNVFAGNTYPDQITPIAPAVPIMRYNNPSKIGGLRAQTATHKLVYFGTGPEQMVNTAVADQMVQLSHDWFYGIVSVEEMDATLAGLLGAVYPIPASNSLIVPLAGLQGTVRLQVCDATGRVVVERAVNTANATMELDVRTLACGTYTLRMIGADRSAARSVQVMR